MRALFSRFLFSGLLVSSMPAWGWGETGHHLVGRQATQLFLNHPQLNAAERKKVATFFSRPVQQGHLGNIPDIHWRNLDGELELDGQVVGDTTHFLDPEVVLPLTPKDPDFFKVKVPLDYEAAREKFTAEKPGFDFYHKFGTAPWRAQQLASLFSYALKNYPNEACAKLTGDKHPTRIAIAYAGILSHFVSDMSQPYHATLDYDGVAAGLKGAHSYVETELVDVLDELTLKQKTLKRAQQMLGAGGEVEKLRQRAREVYPEQREDQATTALVFALAEDSYRHLLEIQQLDAKYAVATLGEALEMEDCKTLKAVVSLNESLAKATTPEAKNEIRARKILSALPTSGAPLEKACRRPGQTKVDKDGNRDDKGKSVASYFEPLLVDRLALGAALTADIWATLWKEAGSPGLCFTWKYALKPHFVSPTDPNCFGYALNEDPKHFLRKDGSSVLPWKSLAPSPAECLSF